MKQFLNFQLIWELQALPPELVKVLGKITKQVYEEIIDPPSGIANVAQWCKREACWDNVKELDLPLVVDSKLLVSKEEDRYKEKVEKSEKALESGIQIQGFVVLAAHETWGKLVEYYTKSGSAAAISGAQLDILTKMSRGSLGLPSEKQSRILYQLYHQALSQGLVMT